ncbi:hypothetical protein [Kozakia baliensis]|uniref:hypothetical protein n=1 Tax=Kozakia baliensis TaxID=153496 RepID=UPI0013144436|nr:hypothetical protein [Kozakia baliensis]
MKKHSVSLHDHIEVGRPVPHEHVPHHGANKPQIDEPFRVQVELHGPEWDEVR